MIQLLSYAGDNVFQHFVFQLQTLHLCHFSCLPLSNPRPHTVAAIMPNPMQQISRSGIVLYHPVDSTAMYAASMDVMILCITCLSLMPSYNHCKKLCASSSVSKISVQISQVLVSPAAVFLSFKCRSYLRYNSSVVEYFCFYCIFHACPSFTAYAVLSVCSLISSYSNFSPGLIFE